MKRQLRFRFCLPAMNRAIVMDGTRASRPIRAILLNTKDGPAEVVLPILGPIAGRVHDKAGRPLAGITVGRLIDEGEKGPEVYPHFFSETVATGPDGKFAYAPMVIVEGS
jgi:hypothetical protein